MTHEYELADHCRPGRIDCHLPGGVTPPPVLEFVFLRCVLGVMYEDVDPAGQFIKPIVKMAR